MNSVSPVMDSGNVENERVIALDQSEYSPLIVLPTLHQVGSTKIQGATIRLRLTDEERQLISEGADIVLSEVTFGKAWTPISIWVEHARD